MFPRATFLLKNVSPCNILGPELALRMDFDFGNLWERYSQADLLRALKIEAAKDGYPPPTRGAASKWKAGRCQPSVYWRVKLEILKAAGGLGSQNGQP